MATIGNAQQVAELCSEYRGPLPLILAWTLGATATIIVGLRLYVKIGLHHKMGWDDYTIVIALILSQVDNAIFTLMFQSGVGRHIFCLSKQQAYDTVKWSTIAQIIEVVDIALMKISLILFIQRILDRASRRLWHSLNILIGFIVITHFIPLILYCVQCVPLVAVWDPTVQGQCYSQHLTYTAAYVAIAMDALTDFICAAIPIFVIWQLQMQFRMKLAICVLMSLGVLTAACAIGKAVYLEGVFQTDYTWAITTPAIWSIAETQIGMNVTSIPAIRPIFSKVAELTSSWSRPWSPAARAPRSASSRSATPMGPRIHYTPDESTKNSTCSDKPIVGRVPAKAPKVHTGFTQNLHSQSFDTDREGEYGFEAVVARHGTNEV